MKKNVFYKRFYKISHYKSKRVSFRVEWKGE